MLVALSLVMATAASPLIGRSALELAVFIEDPGGWHLENAEDAILLLRAAFSAVSSILFLFAGAVALAAIASSLLQNPPRFIFSRIAPDLSRISLGAGFRRIFNWQALTELLKAVAKIVAVALAAFAGLGGLATGFYTLHSAPDAIPDLIAQLGVRVLFICAVMATAIAVADIFFTRTAWNKAHMMSKQEIKQELKQAEGDVMLKARLRAIARARIKRLMLQSVPKATLVVANPTHYAVALRYVRGEDTAPKVLARGQDSIALKIREVAKQHNVPVFEDKLLAKSLFEATKVDQHIPPEFYKAIAGIIIFLNSKSHPRQPKGLTTPPKSSPAKYRKAGTRRTT